MQQLSSLDATFLFLETAEMPMHAGAVKLLHLPAGFRGRFVTALRQHVKDRLPALPMLCRRLWWMPLNMANPAWVDVEPDLRVHIVAKPLPRGAGIAELEDAVARLHAQRLDRERPLWMCHVFEGLTPGARGERRAAVYMQLHHAAFDAQAIVALGNGLMELTPQSRRLSTSQVRRRKVFEPGMSEMLRGVLGGQVAKVAELVREMPSAVGSLRGIAGRAVSQASLVAGSRLRGQATLAPVTPYNVTLRPERCFATLSLPRAAVHELGVLHDATLEDMVLLLCGSALRRHLARRHLLPRRPLVAAVPTGLHAAGDAPPSLRLVSLGTHLADPLRRLSHVRDSTRAPRRSAALPADYPSLGVPWLLEAASRLYGRARVAERLPRLANLLIGMVPGPSTPLYLAGARLQADFPASILLHGLALNITVQMREESLDFGVVADCSALPHARGLADDIRVALDDLLALPRPGEGENVGALQALTGRAHRMVSGATGAVAGAVTKTVGGAVAGALGKVTQHVVGSALEIATSRLPAAPPKTDPTKPRRRR